MKKEISTKPEAITEQWPGELTSFSWQDFVTAIPSPLFLISTYKSNGNCKEAILLYEKAFNVKKEKSITIDPLETLPYSPLAVQFIDKFGVQWGFMVEESAED